MEINDLVFVTFEKDNEVNSTHVVLKEKLNEFIKICDADFYARLAFKPYVIKNKTTEEIDVELDSLLKNYEIDLIVLVGFGGGLTWGAIAMRWGL